MAVAIHAEGLLRELDEVWISLGKQQQESGGVQRACALTLIAVTEDGSQMVDVAETLGELMHDHPARAIIVRVGGASELSARTTAQCWMPFGRREQICCEQIEITTPAKELREVPPVLRGLMVADLPVVLWVRNAALLRNPELAAFVDLASKVIVEPRGFTDSAWLRAKLIEISASGRAVSDLSWTRITRWRETIARLFDDPARAAALSRIQEIVIRHSPPAPGPAVEYLAAWIRLSLGRFVRTRFESSPDGQSWQIQQVELRGGGFAATIERAERGVVKIRADGVSTCAVFRLLRETDLLHEELSIPRDPLFERVLRSV